MDGPRIDWTGHWSGVPELCLEELATGCIEATQVLNDGGVMTAKLRVEACCRRACKRSRSKAENDSTGEQLTSHAGGSYC